MIRLLIQSGGQSRELSFDDAVVTFGSGASCKVRLDDPQADAEQCRIEKAPNGWKLVDLESTNGTAVNGAVVNARLLKDGDVIRIGEFEAVFNPAGGAKSGAKPGRAAARASADALFWIKTGGVAAAVLIATIACVKIFAGDGKIEAQRASLQQAQQTAAGGDLDAAEQAINALLAAPIDAGVQREAKKALEDIRSKIAARNEREQKALEAAIAAEEASRRAAEFRILFDEATATSDRLVVQENFGEALGVWKSFAHENTDADFVSKIDGRMKEVLKASQDAWEALETRANSLVKMEEYPQAALAVSSAIEKFQGTRFRYRAQEKLEGIRRLMGVTAAYVAGGTNLSAGAQDSLLAVDDLVKARRYARALRQIDGLLASVDAGQSSALRAQREEIAAQSALFDKLVSAVNNGWFAEHPIELGNGTKAILAKATDEVLEIEFKDEEGKGGTSARKWPQVEAEDMLGYFRSIELGPEDSTALAAFCYSNGLSFAGAEILRTAMGSDAAKKAAAFELIARHRGIPVPEGGFVWYEGGWYTAEELKFARLDLDVKKAALLLGQIDARKAEEGMALYRRATGDPSAGTELKAKAVTLCSGALKTRRTSILKRLQDSRGLVNPAVMTALKKELIKRRQAAIKVIFDKKIYPDEDHGKVGQPAVDEAVGKVKELWDHPLQVISKSNPAIENMIAASRQTDSWLGELGVSATEAEKALVAKLLVQVDEALSLKNYPISGNERSQLEKFRAIMSYNDRHLGFDDKEKDCIRATNEYRFMLGYQAVEAQGQLGRAARKHSEEMEKLNYFAHSSPTKGLETPGQRCAAEGYGGGGAENIAMGNTEGEPTFMQWYNSSGHHRNMLGGHMQIGIGRSNNYWTENFGSSGPSMKDKVKVR
ncbi:MAG: hypothetical protein FD180_4325 [Planctomycetota bacterium]|nr:MAG: hypothetical protein FD180_4325 [Planctomycetota bacterium]